MNPEVILTPEQNQQMDSWVAQRDAILLSISTNREVNDGLVKSNKALAESNTELHDKINVSIGRLEEIEKQEKERASLTSKEIETLSTEKGILQAELVGLKAEIAALVPQKTTLVEDIKNAKDTYDRVFDRVTVLDKVVEHVTAVSAENIKEINSVVITLKSSVQEVIDTNTLNVDKANHMITELPRIFFALQRQVPVKKTIFQE